MKRILNIYNDYENEALEKIFQKNSVFLKKIIYEINNIELKENDPEEIKDLVIKSIIDLNAETTKDIGKVMGFLKSNLQGKADMSVVSKIVKKSLNK